jgi:hypothetical protein
MLAERIEYIAKHVAGYMNARDELLTIAVEVRKLEAREQMAFPKTGGQRLDDWAQTTCSSAVARLERALQRVEGGDAG